MNMDFTLTVIAMLVATPFLVYLGIKIIGFITGVLGWILFRCFVAGMFAIPVWIIYIIPIIIINSLEIERQVSSAADAWMWSCIVLWAIVSFLMIMTIPKTES